MRPDGTAAQPSDGAHPGSSGASAAGSVGPLSRRGFVGATGLGLAGLLFDPGRTFGRGAFAGPFSRADFDDFPIPADKKLDPAWVASLTARGEPQWFTSARDELKLIGMPVGGICTGQVYLSGDGRLWHWDIFNLPPADEWRNTQGPHYAKPAAVASPVEQGFALRWKNGSETLIRRLDATGFADVRFRGEYPIGIVEYRDGACPLLARLEAFSPFIPLKEDDSGLPATVMEWTITNTSDRTVDFDIAGWLENAVCLGAAKEDPFLRRNRVVQERGLTMIECGAEEPPPRPRRDDDPRPEIVFEDFEKGTYEGWEATGTAFGAKPRNLADIAGYQGNLNAQGEWTVNTHETRQGEDVRVADTHLGTLTSRAFKIERRHIRFRIGGGNHPGETCINLLVDGEVKRTTTGRNQNRMRSETWDVREFEGRQARIQIVDNHAGGWGQVGIDEIVFTDEARAEPFVLKERPDHGTMAFALLRSGPEAGGAAVVADGRMRLPEEAFIRVEGEQEAVAPDENGCIGAISVWTTRLAPGASATFTFIVAWHFDGLTWDSLDHIAGVRKLRRHYGARFTNASDVARHVAANLSDLAAKTRLWRDTWYDSTLPCWLLDRAFANISTLATSTCLRLSNGRFYGWEGTHCCAGTCQHVWQYAQGVARVFPALERWVREEVDFGLAFREETGAIDYRAEAHRIVAHDGLAGTIIRAWREHTMAPDDAFLRRRWARIRQSVEFLMREDADANGLLEGAQYNTLDATWYGEMAWISSLYLAAVRAGEMMALEMGDAPFAALCRERLARGEKAMVERLFNGEYFIHRPDPAHPEANSTGTGCHNDQLLGQSWAHQCGLGRIVPAEQAASAMRSIYTYCYTPDIGPYRTWAGGTIKGGRWYAMPGEGGLIVCTWPRGGAGAATGKGGEAWAAGYFVESWTGFEYQVAAHMIYEGLIEAGLVVTRTAHERYHASRRNPYNEIECSDHYARALSSYGVFLALCGFEAHGPRGHIGFTPRLSPDDFRAPFTSATAWGTFTQKRDAAGLHAQIAVRWGRLPLRTVSLALPEGAHAAGATARLAGRAVPCEPEQEGSRVTVTLGGQGGQALVGEGDALAIDVRT